KPSVIFYQDKTLNTELDTQALMNEALKILADSHCSEQRLRLALEKKFTELLYVDEAIDAVILRIKELHLLDDKTLAESIAFRYLSKGNRFIAHKLKEKGIDENTITTVIEGLEDEYQRALEAARSKIARSKSPETVANLFRFLSSRGFPFDVINQVSKEFTR
ncbi:MAG: recombination regulator RecX, partial [Silvanigrellaceae bacterium]|nr:recombination regulator RecX [Silvanigrellaceae bacterium]